MGNSDIFDRWNWQGILVAVSNVSSAFLVILCSKATMTTMQFEFPASLSFLQNACISLSLWFWAVFGLFKPRRLPLREYQKTVPSTAICCVLTMEVLKRNSLSIFQVSQILVSPIAFAIEASLYSGVNRDNTKVFLPRGSSQTERALRGTACAMIFCACCAVSFEPDLTGKGLAVAIFSTLCQAANRIFSEAPRQDVHANELQLQLYIRTASSGFTLLLLPITDELSLLSEDSLWNYTMTEGASVLMLCTCLFSFISFVSSRAAASSNSKTSFVLQLSCISAAVFLVDAAFPGIKGRKSVLSVLPYTAVLVASGAFSFLREDQRDEALSGPRGFLVDGRTQVALPATRARRNAGESLAVASRERQHSDFHSERHNSRLILRDAAEQNRERNDSFSLVSLAV